jgi:hypothetical protein
MNSLPTIGLQRSFTLFSTEPRAKLPESLAASEIGATPEVEQLRASLRKIQPNRAQSAAGLLGLEPLVRLRMSYRAGWQYTERTGALPKRSDWDETKHKEQQPSGARTGARST